VPHHTCMHTTFSVAFLDLVDDVTKEKVHDGAGEVRDFRVQIEHHGYMSGVIIDRN